MIVVDTSVWLDFLQGRDEPHVSQLLTLIEYDAGLALTDVVLTEVLQGLPNESQARRVEQRLRAFDVLRLREVEDFSYAATLYRAARARDSLIRRRGACLVAAVCIREQVPLLHNDADFDRLAAVTPLQLHGP